ncbi:hypothetical protein U91I_02059 [alpha proteobacterium U9-1i]|nr:hypothetical protein U91I_02059 [alpha proteobacterium U9-1i]
MSKTIKTGAFLGAILGASAIAASAFAQTSGVSFVDPSAAPGESPASTLSLQVRGRSDERFQELGLNPDGTDERAVQIELAANGDRAGVPVDVSIAPRASIGADSQGDLSREGRGVEARLGQGLARDEGSRDPRWYVFAASDDEAVTWQPGTRSEFGGRGASLAMQDRVEVGDMSAGVTYERNGVQASLAYVEREISSTVGIETISRNESFAGVTLTMRR